MKAIIEKAASKYDNRNELDVLNSRINSHETPKPPEPEKSDDGKDPDESDE